MNTSFVGGPQPGSSHGQVLQAMKFVRRWLLWLPIEKRKIPYYVNGSPRGATDTPEDIAQLASFDDAVTEALKRRPPWGIGFALGPDGTGNYWQGIDLDKIDENELASVANTLPGYVEFSPSGLGCHAIGYGKWFNNLDSDGSGVEAYCEKRFFTFTGNPIEKRL